jgi:MauM/NapG family ferredoxin protein
VRNSTGKPGRFARPWITIRKVVQVLALSFFLVLFIGSHAGRISEPFASLPLRLDPLITLSNLLANRTFLVGSALALITLGMTLLAGRAWCGWLCPLGTLLEFFSLRRWRQHRWELPDSLRQIKYILLLIILFAALFTNLTLLVLDPLTLLTRTLTVSIWPALDHIVTSVEAALYQVPFLRPAISTIDPWLRPGLFPQIFHAYQGAILFIGIFTALVGLNLLAERFWCRCLCPLGGMLGLLSKIAILRREVSPECTQCDLCADPCPTGTIDPSNGYKSDPGECTMCMECLYGCPFESTTFVPQFGIDPWYDYDPDRRKVLMTFGAAVAGAALLSVDSAGDLDRPYLLRPPGVKEDELLSTCVRCGECIRTCPSGALQPALMEAGLEGFWTPLLIPRMGYCDYSCNACGLNCPVEAIPPLSLEHKRVQVMGKASVDHNRCLAWAEDTPCIVCEEMCPLPEKAIVLEEVEIQDVNGRSILLQRPRVILDRCIGCGICEYKCPVQGEAAIRVFIDGTGSGTFV